MIGVTEKERKNGVLDLLVSSESHEHVITSFIIHNLGWQARSRFLSRLSEMPQLAQVNSPR